MTRIYVSDLQIEERAYQDHIPLIVMHSNDTPDGWLPDPIHLRILKRTPNPHHSPDAPVCSIYTTHRWGTHSTWGPSYCGCGAFWYDRYHSSVDPSDDPYHANPGTLCRIIEIVDVMYSRQAGAIYGVAECGELVLWAD